MRLLPTVLPAMNNHLLEAFAVKAAESRDGLVLESFGSTSAAVESCGGSTPDLALVFNCFDSASSQSQTGFV